MSRRLSRRGFIGGVAAGAALTRHTQGATAELPRDDPAKDANCAWTARLRWDNVLNIREVTGEGEFWDERLRAAQATLRAMDGGTVYFPPGDYAFRGHILLGDGILLRGAPPSVTSAHDGAFEPPSRITFPRYVPLLSGNGTPIDTAFKGIRLEDPARAANCGVAHLSINRGHIHLGTGENHQCGANRIVFGCMLRNCAVADPGIPDLDIGQHPWQRFTARHHAAIDIKASENILVANNRLPQSGDDNFTMPEYVLKPSRERDNVLDVVFDYDNRPGIYVNHYCIGGAGGSGNDGTPETHPWGFRNGIVIRGNYVYNTGRMAIGFAGDGVRCANNVVRFAKDVWRPTTTGANLTTGSATNDNRAVEMRGWGWILEDNDYEVHRNYCSDRNYYINDGEGLMHEDHCNSDLRDSRIVNNRGNSYLSLYKCGVIDGLHIEGNDISTPGKIADIYVVANRNSGPQPCRNVTIANNTTRSNGIHIVGEPASNNVISGNRHVGESGEIRNGAAASISDNMNYREVPA